MFGNLDYWDFNDGAEYQKGDKWLEWQEKNKEIVDKLKGNWSQLRQFLYMNLQVWDEGMGSGIDDFKQKMGFTGYKDRYFDAYVNHYAKWLNKYLPYIDEKRSDINEDDFANMFADQVAATGTFKQPREYDLVANYTVEGERMHMGPMLPMSVGEIRDQQIDDEVFIGGKVTQVDPYNDMFFIDGKYECRLSGLWDDLKRDYFEDYQKLLYCLDNEDVVFAGTYYSLSDEVGVRGYVQVKKWQGGTEVGWVDTHLFEDWK